MPRMHRHQHALDLFGDVPVTTDDIELWCLAVAGIAPGSPRFAIYARDYDAAAKVRAAKLAGQFERIINDAHCCPMCRR